MRTKTYSPGQQKTYKGVSRDLTQHNLNVAKGVKPRKQKLRKMSTERAEAAEAEV